MTQHELMDGVRIVHEYNIDTLGSPFRVTLIDSVSVWIDPLSGKEKVSVPDPVGLINAVVRSRVEHPRKLNGKEIAFVRKALGLRSKALADFLSVSPEHFSRCEAGAKVMSASSEKLLRLFAFLGTFSKDPADLVAKCSEEDALSTSLESSKIKDATKILEGFLRVFLEMKIQVMSKPGDELNLRFVHRPREMPAGSPEDDEDGEWGDAVDAVAA